MAATEEIAIVRLGVEDAAAGLALSTEARWNQNEADWRFFLSNGIVFGVRDDAARLIATAALLPYSAGNAWISMVLVTESWRRRGIATKLVDACLATAHRMNLTSWLDATPDGAQVYGPLGFTPTLQLRRLRLATSGRSTSRPALDRGDLAALTDLDRRTIGFARDQLLAEFSGRPGSRLVLFYCHCLHAVNFSEIADLSGVPDVYLSLATMMCKVQITPTRTNTVKPIRIQLM